MEIIHWHICFSMGTETKYQYTQVMPVHDNSIEVTKNKNDKLDKQNYFRHFLTSG